MIESYESVPAQVDLESELEGGAALYRKEAHTTSAKPAGVEGSIEWLGLPPGLGELALSFTTSHQPNGAPYRALPAAVNESLLLITSRLLIEPGDSDGISPR